MTVRASSSFPADAGTFRADGVGNARAGCCTLCRSARASDAKPCVDLGPNSRPFREGRVVVCFNCAVSIGEAVGMMSSAKALELGETAMRLGLEVDRLRAELDAFAALREALDAMSSAPAKGAKR